MWSASWETKRPSGLVGATKVWYFTRCTASDWSQVACTPKYTRHPVTQTWVRKWRHTHVYIRVNHLLLKAMVVSCANCLTLHFAYILSMPLSVYNDKAPNGTYNMQRGPQIQVLLRHIHSPISTVCPFATSTREGVELSSACASLQATFLSPCMRLASFQREQVLHVWAVC